MVAEKYSLENLNILVVQIPLLNPEGAKINFASLDSHDQWAIAASRIVLESLMVVKDKAFFSTFSDNALAVALAPKGYIYGRSFREVEVGAEVIYFKDWHQFILSSCNDLPRPSIQVVKVGAEVQSEREVTVLSHQWSLTGLEADPERGWGNWAMQAATHSLVNGKLALQVQPFGLGMVGQEAIVDGAYYGLLMSNI